MANNGGPAIQKKLHVHYINWLVLFREIISVYFGNHQKHVSTAHGQNTEVFILKAGSMYNNHCPEKELLTRMCAEC